MRRPMTEDEFRDRATMKLRAQYWDALPTNAYRVRRLIRKERASQLEPGEREELELLVQRLADSAHALGFAEVADVTTEIAQLLREQRAGGDVSQSLEGLCDRLDHIIDDMTLEALAVGLRSLWYG